MATRLSLLKDLGQREPEKCGRITRERARNKGVITITLFIRPRPSTPVLGGFYAKDSLFLLVLNFLMGKSWINCFMEEIQ